MDYFDDALTMFLSLDCLRTLAVYGRIHQKYLNLCSIDEQRSYRFGTT